ncbi:MAG: catalase, partial [Gammaproteobacteria bacterium]|nr:catalase [Gammaproteobacteria bacterium]
FYPVFFNRDPAEFESFIRYQADGSEFGYFLQGLNPANWKLRELLIGSRVLNRIANPLYTQYYSMTAYALGVDTSGTARPYPYRHAMKYSAKSCTPPDHRSPDTSDDDYLRRSLAEHMAKADGCFEFLVQVQDPAKNMPIEDPTVRWREADAPFQEVARIRIPRQEFDTPAQNEFCENMAFTPWHGHVDLRPLGGLNRIRKAVYEGIAVYRHARNGVDFREPTGWCLKLDGSACDDPAERAE